MKKIVSILLALICLMMFASCSNRGNSGNNGGDSSIIEFNRENFDAELTIWWAPGDKYNVPLENGLKRIKEKHPEFSYEIKQQPSTDYYDRLSTTLLPQNPKNAPDIVRISNTGVQTMAAYGKFLNLSKIKGNDEFGNNFFKNMWDANKLGDDVYAFPLDANTMTLMYNTEIFKKCGIVDENGDAKAPTNITEFEAACDKVLAYNKANNKAILPYDVALRRVAGSADLPVFCMTSNLGKLGGRMLTEDNKHSTFGSEESKKLIEIMKRWKEKGYIDGSWREGEFYTGDVAMFEMGSWNKNKVLGESATVEGVKVAQTFTFEEGKPATSTLGLYSLAIYDGKDFNKKEVAYNVLCELLMDNEFMLEFCKSADLLPTREVVYNDEYFNTEFYNVFKQQLTNAIARPGSPAWKDIEKFTANMLEKIFVTGGVTDIDGLLSETKSKIDKKIQFFDDLIAKNLK